jgi:ribosomal protein S27AE
MKTCPNCGKTLDSLGLCPDAKPDDVRKGFAFCSAIPVTESHPESCSCDRCKLTRKIISA